MKNREETITNEIQKLKKLKNRYYELNNILVVEKNKLIKFNNYFQNMKKNAERKAMFFEDNFSRTKKEILPFYFKRIDEIDLKVIEERLRMNYLKWKELKSEVKNINSQDIEMKFEKITMQHNLLIEEEKSTLELKACEEKNKDEELEKYNLMMNDFNNKSLELENLCKTNKYKKMKIDKIIQSNDNLKYCVQESQDYIKNREILIKEYEEYKRKYQNIKEENYSDDRFKKLEEEIKKMQKDNLVLKEEEDKLNKELQDIQNKYNKKCNEFKKILGELDSYQNNIDSLLK